MSRLRAPACLLALLALALSAAPAALAADPPNAPAPSAGFDNELSDVAIAGSTAFVVGAFRSAGEPVGGALSTDPVSGARLPAGIPAVAGRVAAILPDGAGGWYVGGRFDQIGDRRLRDVAHVLPDGSVDPGFLPPRLDGTSGVTALALWGSPATRLILGGDFSCVGGDGDNVCGEAGESAQSSLTALDRTSGGLVAGFFGDTQLNSGVGALLTTPTRLVVGGSFSCIGGDGDAVCLETPQEVERRSIVAFTSGGARDDTWTPEIDDFGGFSPSVSALAADGSRLVVGGRFACAGDDITSDASCTGTAVAARRNVAVFELPGVDDTLQALAPNPSSSVSALALTPDRLYLGGAFDCLEEGTLDGVCAGGDPPRVGAAAFTLTNDVLAAWNPKLGPDASVAAISAGAGAVHLTGSFSCAGWTGGACADPGETPRRNAVAVDPLSAAVLPWNPSLGRPGTVLARAGSGPVAIGGDLRVSGAVERRGTAAIDLRSGALLPWAPSTSGADDKQSGARIALAPDGHTAYAAMSDPVCTGSDEDGTCADPGESDRGALVAIDTTSGALAPGFTPRPFPAPASLATGPDGTVYLGGLGCLNNTAGDCGNEPGEISRRGGLAALTPSGAVLPWAPATGPGGELEDLAIAAGRVYVVGGFTCAGGTDGTCANEPGEASRRGGAAFDAASGALLGFDPQASWGYGPNGAWSVREVEAPADGSRVLLAGSFRCLHTGVEDEDCSDAGEVPRPALAAVDAVSGAPQTWGPASVVASAAPAFRTLATSFDGASVLIGGAFLSLDGQPRPGLAALRSGDGGVSGWSPGLTGTVFRLASGSGVTVAAGGFDVAGGAVRMGFARFGDYVAPPPTPAGTTPASAEPDRTAPVPSGLKAGRRFRRGTTLVRVAAAAKAVRVGTIVSFSLSEAASVRFSVARKTTGRRSGKRCVALTRSNRRAKRCLRVAPVKGSATVPGRSGRNRVGFAGRLSARVVLRPGAYVLTALATDAAGNRSAARTAPFTLLGPRHAAKRR